MKKINLFLIACAVSFIGYAQVNATDPTVYAPMNGFALSNKWLVSSMAPLENFHYPSPFFRMGNYNRNMVLRDGILYFANRKTFSLDRMNAADGTILPSIDFLEVEAMAGFFETFFPFNGLQKDATGNLVTNNLLLNANAPFQVWVLDTENPANSHMVINDVIANLAEKWEIRLPDPLRIDFIGVYGNILEDGMILAATTHGNHVLKWNVENGQAELDVFSGMIRVDLYQIGILPIFNFSVMPTVTPINRDVFWLNIGSQPLLMMDMLGSVTQSMLDDFPFANWPNVNPSNFRHPQGAVEFELRGNLFLIIPYRNWASGIGNNLSFRMFRFADENRDFAEMIPMWEFPKIGLGNVGSTATGAMGVEVDDEAGLATIAIYVPGNGYGVYELRICYYDCEPHVSETTVIPTESSVTIEWTHIEDTHYYALTLFADAERTQEVTHDVIDAQNNIMRSGNDNPMLSHTVVGLNPNTQFFYSLTAHNNDGEIVNVLSSGDFTTLEAPTNIPEINVNRTPVAFYSIMGVRLGQEPQSGIFIIRYCDGSAERVMR